MTWSPVGDLLQPRRPAWNVSRCGTSSQKTRCVTHSSRWPGRRDCCYERAGCCSLGDPPLPRRSRLAYAFIGGMAVQQWGEPRFTQDVDLTVAAPLDAPERFIGVVLERFASTLPDAAAFAPRRRIIRFGQATRCAGHRKHPLPSARRIGRDLSPAMAGDFADLLANPEVLARFERPWLRLYPRSLV